jgi:pyruvate/2-oxoglutarate dehydrogenase complex dihydrolipoamide dehydrogenase (E3) component
MPSKNEIWTARAAHFVHHAAEYGMTTGPIAIDMAVVRDRKRKMVRPARRVSPQLRSGWCGIDHGVGAFRGAEDRRGHPQ